jgi:hypothetical protein
MICTNYRYSIANECRKEIEYDNDQNPKLLNLPLCNELQVKTIIEKTQNKPEQVRVLDLSLFNGAPESIIQSFRDHNFNFTPQMREIAMNSITQDILLSNILILPTPSQISNIQKGDLNSNSSTLESYLFKKPINLKGISSWLLEKWNDDKSDSESDNDFTDTSHSATSTKTVKRPVKADITHESFGKITPRKRHLSADRIFRNESSPMTQPVVSRASSLSLQNTSHSQPLPSTKITKRKKGF